MRAGTSKNATQYMSVRSQNYSHFDIGAPRFRRYAYLRRSKRLIDAYADLVVERLMDEHESPSEFTKAMCDNLAFIAIMT